MAKKKQNTVQNAAYAYMKRAAPRFRRKHQCNDESCEFCAGWTWGAVDGYLAAAKQAKKVWPRSSTKGK